jgi:hypothetical protein
MLDAIYSASVVLKVTKFCILLYQETMVNFMVEYQSNVLFQSIVLFAQSESVYSANSSSHWRHISDHIQLCLVFISIHVLLLPSEFILVDSSHSLHGVNQV